MADKQFYVYLHKDKYGNTFYVGKGTGNRAWSLKRHIAWQKYVSQRLKGSFTVEIYKDNLDEKSALDLENTLINLHGESLVNWLNPKRDFDYEALEKFHQKRDANRAYVVETKVFEKNHINEAISRYRKALSLMREYESLTLERGLIADLNVGPNWGDPYILDRLTLCLIKQGRRLEALQEAEQYFRDFPSVLTLSIGRKINARIQKIKTKNNF